jgi:hypothetical protein
LQATGDDDAGDARVYRLPHSGDAALQQYFAERHRQPGPGLQQYLVYGQPNRPTHALLENALNPDVQYEVNTDTSLETDGQTVLTEFNANGLRASTASSRKRVREGVVQDPCFEDTSLAHTLPQCHDYYAQFTDLTICERVVPIFDRCWVNLNNTQVMGVVVQYFVNGAGGSMKVFHYKVYDESRRLMGFFASGRVKPRYYGWSLEDIDDGTNINETNEQEELAQQRGHRKPMSVVLTGTFPELGGGSGLELGKAALTQLVKTTRGILFISKGMNWRERSLCWVFTV